MLSFKDHYNDKGIIMIRSVLLSAFSVLLVFGGINAAQAQDAASPHGLWLTENGRSVISVQDCPDPSRLCGYIHWVIDGGMEYDSKNPNESLRNTPMCGLPILGGFKQENANNWIDGKIYKADEGDTYNATLQMLPTGKMLVRGYVGMPLFGKSQTWTRVSGKDFPKCQAPGN